MDPGQGFIEPEDVLELAKEAAEEGALEKLTVTDRANATYQAGLQPFSFDVHVKLGMELLALRRQEALMKLDAEAFGEKLKRRAAIRDMLKKVAKEDSWVQYPAADLARITRALNREDMPEGEEEDVFEEEPAEEDDKDKGKGKVPPSYAKWLERKRRGAVRRAAFGVSVERDMAPVAKTPGASPLPGQEDVGGLPVGRRNSSTSGSTTFGKAHRLIGFPGSRPGSQHTNRRSSTTGPSGRNAHSSGGYEPGQMNGGGAVGVVDYEAFAAGDGAASDTETGEAGASGGRSPHFADIQEAAQVLGLNVKDNSRRRVVQVGGDALSGAVSGANSNRQLKKTQSELLAAVSEAASDVTGLRPTGTQSDWRAAVRSKSHTATAAPGLHPPSASASATASGEALQAPAGPPVPPVSSQLAQLEAAVEAVAALKEEQITTFVTAVEVAAKAAAAAEAAAAAATAGASAEEQASAIKAAGAAANRVLMYDEAAMSVEKLLAESAARLEQARAVYESAHAAKLSAIAGQSELQHELQLLKEWLAGAEQQRLALAAAALAAQRQRLEAAAGAATSPALTKLLEQCSGAAESLGALASGIEAATAEAEAQLVERQRRRDALRLIEDECVKLAADMEQREETERLSALMKAEAEAERAMAEAKNEEEAKQHALMAALIMGEEEWVLEHQVRSAALRAAERDEQRMAALLAAEQDKAAKAGPGFDSTLLDELKELEQEAKHEITYRRERLEEAVKELAVFAEMRRQAAERQAREAAAREALDAEAANAAAGVAASRAEAGMDPASILPPPPPPPPPPAVEESVASRPPSPSPPEPTPEELLQAAVAAMQDCYSRATGAAPSSSQPSDDAAAAAPGAAGADAVPAEESELEKYSRAAQQRLAAARAALEAVIKLREAQKGTSAELSGMADDARRYEVAAAAVREERERVAAALAAEADAKKSAWLAGVLDECNRLYDAMVAAGVAAPVPSQAELLEKEQAAAEAVAAAAAAEAEAAQALAEAEAAVQREQAAAAEAAASAAAVTSTPISPAHTPRVMSPRPPGVSPPAIGSFPDDLNSSPKLRAARAAAAMSLAPPASQAAMLQPVRGPGRPTIPAMPTTVTLGFDPHTNSVTHEWSRSGHPHARSSGPHLNYGGGHLAAAAGGYGSPGARGSIAAGPHSKLAAPYAPPPSHQQQQQMLPPALQSFTYSAAAPPGGGAGPGANGSLHSGPSASGGGLHPSQQQLHLHHAGLAPLQPPPVGGLATGAGPTDLGSPAGGAGRRSFAVNGARAQGQSSEPLPPIHTSANGNNSGLAGAAASALAAQAQAGAPGVGAASLPHHLQQQLGQQPPMRRSEPGMSAHLQGKPGAAGGGAVQTTPNGAAAMPPQHQAFMQQQQQFYQAALAGSPGILQQYSNSPDSGSPSLASRVAGGGGGAHQSVHTMSTAGLPADALQSHLRKQVGAGSGANSTDGSAGPDSGSSTPQRGQLLLRAVAGGAGGGPPQVGIVAFGDATYTQWVAAQAEATPKALEAARQVDEVLSRLPPELHSVLLNAAELLTGVGLDQASMAPPPAQQAPQSQQPAAGANGDNGLPPHLQSLPPVVAKYIMSQLQRIYNNNANGGAGSGGGAGKSPSGGAMPPGRALDHLLSGGAAAYVGADGTPPPRGSNSGMATILMPSATTGLDSSSAAALQLFNQMLPALTQSVAAVRSRLGGGFGAAAVPSSVVFEPAQRSPVGSGAMIGSHLKASRKVRPPGGAEYYEGSGSGAASVAGGGSGLASQASSQAGQVGGGQGAGARRNSRGPAVGGSIGIGGAAPYKGGAAELAQYDLLRYQQEALGVDRWTVRGVNVQVATRVSQPQQQPAGQQRGSGDGAAPQQAGKLAREGSKDTFLPPLGKQHHAVRH